MKWTCEHCKAINAEFSFWCHNCGKDRPIDNGPHVVSDNTAGQYVHRWDLALEHFPHIKKLGLTICDYNCTWYVSAERLETILRYAAEKEKK